MVKAYNDVPGGAPSNLDRVREIIAGADFKAFELKFQRHEEALAAFRDEIRDEIAALKNAFDTHERAQGRDAEELARRVDERLTAIEASVRDLRRETADAVAGIQRGWEQSLDSLRDALEAKIAETAAEAREGLAALGTADTERLDALAHRCARLEDGTAALAGEHGRARDDLAARIADVRGALNEAVATLQQTKLSRYALGEVLLALGAQLLERADKRPQPAASRAPAPADKTPAAARQSRQQDPD